VCKLTYDPGKGFKELPPTAEQTSIARFNALADQIRELEKSLKERQDQDREAISSWISVCERELSAKLDRIDVRSAETNGNVVRNGIFLESLERRIPPRAVAKKKAAPLMGKKGTGRKG
jgi:hypothetical protein